MRKVLIIDDDKDIVQAIEAILALEDYNVIHSFTGRESIVLASREKPDLILLDYMLPDITGKEVVATLRTFPDLLTTPILLISAAHGLKNAIDTLPIQGLLEKPFELEKLLQVVSSYMGEPKNTS